MTGPPVRTPREIHNDYLREGIAQRANIFALDPIFDAKVELLFKMLITDKYLENPANAITFVKFDDTFNEANSFEQIIATFFRTGKKVHKNMDQTKGAILCAQNNVKDTLAEQIALEMTHPTIFTKDLTVAGSDNDGGSNACSIRLNNVHPVNLGAGSYVVKRLTRFTPVPKHNLNFIGSICKKAGRPTNIFADNECEYNELFNCVILSHYLNVMYHSICPKIYGMWLVPNYEIDPAKNMKLTREVFIIEEAMMITAENWLMISHNDAEIKDMITDFAYLGVCANEMKLPISLVAKYPYIFGGNEYIYFGDCKEDNIMLDVTGTWRIIDVDGIRTTSGRDLTPYGQSWEIFPLTCLYPFGEFTIAFASEQKKQFARQIKTNGNLIKVMTELRRFVSDYNTKQKQIVDDKAMIDTLTQQIKNIDEQIKQNELYTSTFAISTLKVGEVLDGVLDGLHKMSTITGGDCSRGLRTHNVAKSAYNVLKMQLNNQHTIY